MKQNCKTILSILKVAENKKKKLINISITRFGFHFLNLLWREGFIYGYFKNRSKVTVFLKSFVSGLDFFSKLIFFNDKVLSWRKIKKLTLLNQNSVFFISTTYGIFSHCFCIKKKLGGEVFSKL